MQITTSIINGNLKRAIKIRKTITTINLRPFLLNQEFGIHEKKITDQFNVTIQKTGF